MIIKETRDGRIDINDLGMYTVQFRACVRNLDRRVQSVL